jgi:hypothetical protein
MAGIDLLRVGKHEVEGGIGNGIKVAGTEGFWSDNVLMEAENVS